jgi:hypothetical protein
MQEHLFCHCSWWKDQQSMLWKAVGKAKGWKAGRCRHVQVSELISMKECDQAVVDFLEAFEGREVPAQVSGGSNGGISFFLSRFFRFLWFFCFHLLAGMKGSGGELRHLAG